MVSGPETAGRIRIFVALEISDAVRQRLAAIEGEFRHTSARWRWVRPENFHITLKFISAVSMEKVEAIIAALRSVRTDGSVEIHLRGLGFVGGGKGGGVFWAAAAPCASLEALARQVDQCLGSLGIPRETRPFSLHVTLARFKDPGGLPELRAMTDKNVVNNEDRDSGLMRTDKFQLIESKTDPAGAIYCKIESFRFAMAAQT